MSFSIPKIPQSKDPRINLIRDIVIIFAIVLGVGSALFAVSGTWPAMVAVESQSMVPNLNVNDLVFVVEENRYGGLMTAVEAKQAGTTSFGEYGDVIIYRPNGMTGVTPIIHRAMTWINASTAEQAGFTGEAAHAGYITKGDNNEAFDQDAVFPNYGRMQPVKEEWIVGKALFTLPMLGFVPLHIFESALGVILIIIILEVVSRKLKKSKETKETKETKTKGKRK